MATTCAALKICQDERHLYMRLYPSTPITSTLAGMNRAAVPRMNELAVGAHTQRTLLTPSRANSAWRWSYACT